MNLFESAHTCLMAADPDAKVTLTRQAARAWEAGELRCDGAPTQVEPVIVPGRPLLPCLVPPRELPYRKLNSREGRAALFHALTHIEFNAINLGWDAVYRFRDLPDAYYADWIRVAREEAEHFVLLRGHLASLGYAYGDFPAHNGLWELALDTSADVLLRMALVPRVMEARGLDVTPGMIERLQAAGDLAAAAILRTILAEEIGHVAVGSRWFHYLCAQRGLPVVETFIELVTTHLRGVLKAPLHIQARQAAGFTEGELAALRVLTDDGEGPPRTAG